MAETGGIQVISRAAGILRLLSERGSALTLGQIAAETGLARSTVQRIIGALSAERFVEMDRSGRGYLLATDFFDLYGEPDAQIIKRFRPMLEAINATTRETVDLSVLRGGQMHFLDQIQGPQRLRAVSSVGEAFPVHSTACGRACLPAIPPDRQTALLHHELDGGGKALSAVTSAVHSARVQGFATDENEHSDGISAIGILVDPNPVAPKAISVPIPSARFDSVKERIIQALLPFRAELAT